VLHERVVGESKERDRPLKDAEKPLLLLQKPGTRVELVAHPLRLPPSLKMTYFDHYMDLLVKLTPKSWFALFFSFSAYFRLLGYCF
jgi:hypothetical protein